MHAAGDRIEEVADGLHDDLSKSVGVPHCSINCSEFPTLKLTVQFYVC